MMIRVGSTGVFLGCEGYNLPPKERCKTTINLIPGEEAVNVDEDEEGNAFLDRTVEHWLPIIPAIGIMWEF